MSAITGLLLERHTQVGRVLSGSLIAFLLHCGLSNLGVVPAECPAYDWCWSYVLPASLSLSVLLATGVQNQDSTSGSSGTTTVNQHVKHVGIAYLLGAAGSVMGAALAFWHSQAVHTLPRETARKVMAAVAATYVGGTVNFFQVAEAVGLGHDGGKSVLGAIAAADIFLMGSYFAFLIVCHRSSTIRRLYPSPSSHSNHRESHLNPQDSSASTSKQSKRGLSLVVALTLSFGISYVSKALESMVGLSGVSAAIITALSLLVYSQWRSRFDTSFRNVQGVVATTSSLLFNMFFAGIGAGARLSLMVKTGPAMASFMGITLAFHALTMATGVWAVNRSSSSAKTRIGISDMVCASNANIGGPATAAAMATSLGCHHLVVPSTIFGTMGYAVATLLGMAMYRLMGN